MKIFNLFSILLVLLIAPMIVMGETITRRWCAQYVQGNCVGTRSVSELHNIIRACQAKKDCSIEPTGDCSINFDNAICQ